MSKILSAKQLAAQLYAKMAEILGDDWRTHHVDFEKAVAAGGDEVIALCKAWRKAFKKRSERKITLADRFADTRPEGEHPDTSAPIADKGHFGRYMSAERRDAIGSEGHAEDDDPQQRGAKYGFVEDSLWHPERLKPFKHHDKPFIWNPVPPREMSAIHC